MCCTERLLDDSNSSVSFCQLSRLKHAVIERAERRIGANGSQCSHGRDRTPVRPSASERTSLSRLTALLIERRSSRRCSDALPVPGVQFRDFGRQDGGGHPADAWRFFRRCGLLFAFRGVVPTGWHAPVRRVDVVCAPGTMLVDRRAGCGMGGIPALAFGDQAVCERTSAGERGEPLPVLGRRDNGQWRLDALRPAGRPTAIQSVGPGQSTAGAGAVRPALEIDPRDRRACLNRQEGGGFAPAAGCDDAPCGGAGVEEQDEGRDLRGGSDAPAALGWRDGDVAPGFGNVNAGNG